MVLHAGEIRVHGRLEAAHVLDGQIVRVARLEVLVEHGEDLIVQYLELAHAVHHSLQRLQRKQPNSNKLQVHVGVHIHYIVYIHVRESY